MMFDGLITRKWAHNCSRAAGITHPLNPNEHPISMRAIPLACGSSEAFLWILARRTKLSMFHQVIAANG